MTDKKKWFRFLTPQTEEANDNPSINVRFAKSVKNVLVDEGELQELFIEADKNPDFNPNYVSSGRSLLEMSIYKFNLLAAKFLLKKNAHVTKTAVRLAHTHSFKTVFGKEEGEKFISLLNATMERQKEEEKNRPKGNLLEETKRFLFNKIKNFGR